LTVFICFLGFAYMTREVIDKGPSVILELNHYLFLFLMAGLLLHWRPRYFVHAISAAVPSVAGVLIQYPLYGGIVKMMTESGLARKLAHFLWSSRRSKRFRFWSESTPRSWDCSSLQPAESG
jgi:short-chain fatty acids transporter